MSSPTPDIWLKADNGPDDPNNGQPVSTWADQSGNGIDFSQSTSGKKPIFRTNRINGKPAVEFDGSDDFLSSSSVRLGARLTIIAVGNFISDGPFWLEQSTNADSNDGFYSHGLASYTMRVRRSTTSLAVNTNSENWWGTGWHYVTFKFDTSLSLRIDGSAVSLDTPVGSAPSDTSAQDDMYLGSRAGTSHFMDGELAELYVFGSALGTSDIETIEDILAEKYGL